jgi:hypothetical protein
MHLSFRSDFVFRRLFGIPLIGRIILIGRIPTLLIGHILLIELTLLVEFLLSNVSIVPLILVYRT